MAVCWLGSKTVGPTIWHDIKPSHPNIDSDPLSHIALSMTYPCNPHGAPGLGHMLSAATPSSKEAHQALTHQLQPKLPPLLRQLSQNM